MEILRLKEVFRTEESFARFLLSSLVIFLSFCLLFLAWFFENVIRFLLPFFLIDVKSCHCWWICYVFVEFLASGWSIEKILAGIFALAFLILLPMSNYLETNVDDLSMVTLFLLSASVDKDDERLMTAIFYFKLIVAILVLFAYNSHIISDMTMYRVDKD